MLLLQTILSNKHVTQCYIVNIVYLNFITSTCYWIRIRPII